MRSGSSARPALALLLVVSMAACVASTLDTDPLERRIERDLSDQLGVDGIEVECPDDVKVRAGAVSTCTARAPGGEVGLRIVVTQVDGEGDVTWEIAGAAE